VSTSIQYQIKTDWPPGGAPTPPALTYVDTPWLVPRPRAQQRVAVMASGASMGGDWSDPPVAQLILLSQPRPKRPGLAVAGHPLYQSAVPFVAPPPANVGEWFRPLNQPSPKRPGLHAASIPAAFQTVQLIVIPAAEPGTWLMPLSQPAPKRPGLRAANQFAFAMGLISYTGPGVQAGSWFRPLNEGRQAIRRGGLRASEIPSTPFTPPFVPPIPPPAGGATQRRRRFVRRGKVY